MREVSDQMINEVIDAAVQEAKEKALQRLNIVRDLTVEEEERKKQQQLEEEQRRAYERAREVYKELEQASLRHGFNDLMPFYERTIDTGPKSEMWHCFRVPGYHPLRVNVSEGRKVAPVYYQFARLSGGLSQTFTSLGELLMHAAL